MCGVGVSSDIENACDLSAYKPSLVSAAERNWYNGFSDANCEEDSGSSAERRTHFSCTPEAVCQPLENLMLRTFTQFSKTKCKSVKWMLCFRHAK